MSGTKWTPDEESALRQIVQERPSGTRYGRWPAFPDATVSLLTGLGAGGAGFAAGGAPGMAMGACRGRRYLAKKAADRMTTGAMDRLGDLARVAGTPRRFRPR